MGQLSNIDFFISRTGNKIDKVIARQINETLKEAGFRTLLQDDNFGHQSFIASMENGFRSLDKSAKLIAILSKDYMTSRHCRAEYHFPLIDDPENENEKLIVFRIEDCSPEGFLKPLPFIDLVPVLHDLERLKEAILIAVKAKEKPKNEWFKVLQKAPQQICHSTIRHTPNFTGREQELVKLKAALWSVSQTAAITQPAAVHGLGGIGKSVLAKEYAWLHKKKYTGIWWINAEQEAGILEGLIDLGTYFIPGLNKVQDREQAANSVLDYLATYYADASKPWLLIYDNIEGEEIFRKYAPKDGAQVLLTSRARNFSEDMASIPVDSWPVAEATSYLKRESGRKFINDEAKQLSEALGHLPLALSHAAAFLKMERLTEVSDYIIEINEWLAEAPTASAYPKSVFATFKQAIKNCEKRTKGVSAVLKLAVFFAPDSIPISFYEQTEQLYPNPLDHLAKNSKSRRTVFSTLQHFSLIELSHDNTSFSFHRLVQSAVKDELAEEYKLWATCAVQVLNSISPEHDFYKYSGIDHFMTHFTTAISEADDSIGQPFAHLLNFTAQNLAHYGISKPELIEPMFRQALSIFENHLGPNHPLVARTLNNLAYLLIAIDRFCEAKLLLNKILEINENKTALEDLTVVKTLNDLAWILQKEHRYDLAEPLIYKALNISKTSLGIEHHFVARTLSNLVCLLIATQRFSEAEPIVRQAIKITEKDLSVYDPNVAIDLNNLGEILIGLNRLEEAEIELNRALLINQSFLGLKHVFVARTLNNLAHIKWISNNQKDSKVLLVRALNICKQFLPIRHPDTEALQKNLEIISRDYNTVDKWNPIWVPI